MKVKIRGKAKIITLDQKDFLAQGGEGTIYVKGDTVYKITNPGSMIPDGKFLELAVLTDPHIMRPQEILVDENDVPTGYTTKFISDAYMMGQIFPKTFRIRNNVAADVPLALVRQMQETISKGVHAHGIKIVDLNELNFLVDKTLKEIYFIDVNSYATKSYPATVIMDSIRDRHVKIVNGVPQFDFMTDWFSFGVISFMLFVGIHPFKGKYASFADPSTSMDQCMKHNISVLNPKVTFPKGATMPFSVIPEVYRRWFEAMFERGQRLEPPSDLIAKVQLITATVQHIKGSVTFVIDEVYDFKSSILSHGIIANRELVKTATHIFVDRHGYTVPSPLTSTKCVMAGGRLFAVWVNNHQLKIFDVMNQKPVDFQMGAEAVMVSDNNLVCRNGTQLFEIKFNEIAGRLIPSSVQKGECTENTTQFFDGCLVQNIFNTYYISMFTEGGQHRQPDVFKPLKGYKIVDAKYDNRVLMIMCINTTTGKYDRFVYSFSANWKDMQSRFVPDVLNSGINFTVRANGIVACITEDEMLEVFHRDKIDAVRHFDDDVIDGDMILSHKGDQTLFYRDSKLYSITAGKKP